MNLLNRFYHFKKDLLQCNYSVFSVFYAISLIVINGIQRFPSFDAVFRISQDLTSNPFSNLENSKEWLLSSYMYPYLAGILKIKSENIFFAFALVLNISLILWAGFLIKKYYSDLESRLACIVFGLSPASLAVFGWIGYSDGFTAFYSIVLVYLERKYLLIVASAIFMGVNHFSQGIVMVALLWMMSFIQFRGANKNFNYILHAACLASGKILLMIYFNLNNFDVTFSRLDYVRSDGFLTFIKSFTINPHIFLYSTFCSLWIFVIYWYMNVSPKERLSLVMPLLFACIITVFCLDQTRVFSLITLPLLFSLIKNSSNDLKLSIINGLFLSALGGIILPKVMVWNGIVYGSQFPVNIQCAITKILSVSSESACRATWYN